MLDQKSASCLEKQWTVGVVGLVTVLPTNAEWLAGCAYYDGCSKLMDRHLSKLRKGSAELGGYTLKNFCFGTLNICDVVYLYTRLLEIL